MPKKVKAKKKEVSGDAEVADTEAKKKVDVPEGDDGPKEVVKKGKKRKAETAVAASAENGSADADAKTPRTKKSRKNKKGEAASGSAEATPEENRRRELQRELMQLTLKLRAEGKHEQDIFRAKNELKEKHGAMKVVDPEGKKALKYKAYKEWAESDKGKKEIEKQQKRDDKEKDDHRNKKHELVVIPIIWRGRHDAKDLLSAAEDVKACVAQQGVDVWIDARRHYMPGQKFAHWEHRGVMLRVEIGPEDLLEGMCRVCLAKTPGEYKTVEKKRVRLPPIGSRKLLLTLKEWGLDKIQVDKRAGDSDEEEAADVAYGTKATQKSGGAPDGDEELQGNWAPSAATEKKQKKLNDKLKHKGKLRR